MRHGDIGLIVSTDAGFLELHKVYRESSNIILRYNSVPYRMINMRLWWGNRKYLTGAQSRNLAAPTALFIIITQEELLQKIGAVSRTRHRNIRYTTIIQPARSSLFNLTIGR